MTEAKLKMLPDSNHVIPIIEHSRRGNVIKKIKSVFVVYAGTWERERWIREMGLRCSGRMFSSSVLYYQPRPHVVHFCKNHRMYNIEKFCAKLDLELQRGHVNEVLAAQA